MAKTSGLLFNSSDPEQRKQFRNAAVGWMRALIRARAVQEPASFTTEDRNRWQIPETSN